MTIDNHEAPHPLAKGDAENSDSKDKEFTKILKVLRIVFTFLPRIYYNEQ